MQVTLCDTACGNKIVGSRTATSHYRIAIGDIRYRISVEVTKPKQKFYRHLDLCEPCLDNLKIQLEKLLSSFMGHGDPATNPTDDYFIRL